MAIVQFAQVKLVYIITIDVYCVGNLTIGFDVEEMVVPENAGNITVSVTATVAIQGTVELMLSVLDMSAYGNDVGTCNLNQNTWKCYIAGCRQRGGWGGAIFFQAHNETSLFEFSKNVCSTAISHYQC